MRVMVMGAGALGGYFGARLAAAGHEVSFVARGAHLEAMRKDGLRVESPLGDLHLPDVAADADPAALPRPDWVLFMVKNRDVESAARALLPALGPETLVVTGQNGVSAPDRLGAIVGAKRVVAGVVVMPADIRAPGVIRHSAPFHRIVLGVPGTPVTPGCAAIVEALKGAGIEATAADDINARLWEKFAGLSTLAAITSLTRLDIGPIRESPQCRALLRAALEEASAVARACCPTLDEAAMERSWAMLTETLPPHTHASMQDDLLRGRPIELNWLSGEIVRLGAEKGVPTPVHAVVTAALQPYAEGAPAPAA